MEVRFMEDFQRNLDFCSHLFRKRAHYFVTGRSMGSFRTFVSIFVGFLGLPSDFLGEIMVLPQFIHIQQ